jgi:ABC-type nitrate/sulfonate/bicarbonate transport system ATPase subunit
MSTQTVYANPRDYPEFSKPGFVIIHGKRGTGKSTLVREIFKLNSSTSLNIAHYEVMNYKHGKHVMVPDKDKPGAWIAIDWKLVAEQVLLARHTNKLVIFETMDSKTISVGMRAHAGLILELPLSSEP